MTTSAGGTRVDGVAVGELPDEALLAAVWGGDAGAWGDRERCRRALTACGGVERLGRLALPELVASLREDEVPAGVAERAPPVGASSVDSPHDPDDVDARIEARIQRGLAYLVRSQQRNGESNTSGSEEYPNGHIDTISKILHPCAHRSHPVACEGQSPVYHQTQGLFD